MEEKLEFTREQVRMLIYNVLEGEGTSFLDSKDKWLDTQLYYLGVLKHDYSDDQLVEAFDILFEYKLDWERNEKISEVLSIINNKTKLPNTHLYVVEKFLDKLNEQ